MSRIQLAVHRDAALGGARAGGPVAGCLGGTVGAGRGRERCGATGYLAGR